MPIERRHDARCRFGRLLAGSAVAGLAILVLNTTLAVIGGYAPLHFTTYQTYLTLVAIVMVMSFLRWGTLVLLSGLASMTEKYAGGEVPLLVEERLVRTTSNLWTFVASLFMAAFFVGIFYACWVDSSLPLLPRFLADVWYEAPGLGFKRTAILTTLVVAGVLAGTSGYQILVFSFSLTGSVRRAFRFESVHLARSALEPLARVSRVATWSWSLGIALTLTSLFPGRTPFVWILMAALATVSVVVYSWPQAQLHFALEEAKRSYLDSLRPGYQAKLRRARIVGRRHAVVARGNIQDLRAWEELYRTALQARTWFVRAGGALQLAAALALPIAAMYLKEFLVGTSP